jgi:hypothetical protein
MRKALGGGDERWLDLWSVRWVLRLRPVPGRPGKQLLVRDERPTALPRARLLGASSEVRDDEAAYQSLAQRAFDERSLAVLTGVDAQLSGGAAKGSLRWTGRGAGRFSLEAAPEQASLLVIAENWYPSWRCKVDGASAPVWKAYGAQMAVRLPAGKHRVEFDFDPTLFHLGLALAVAGIAFCIGLFLLDRRRADA